MTKESAIKDAGRTYLIPRPDDSVDKSSEIEQRTLDTSSSHIARRRVINRLLEKTTCFELASESFALASEVVALATQVADERMEGLDFGLQRLQRSAASKQRCANIVCGIVDLLNALGFSELQFALEKRCFGGSQLGLKLGQRGVVYTSWNGRHLDTAVVVVVRS